LDCFKNTKYEFLIFDMGKNELIRKIVNFEKAKNIWKNTNFIVIDIKIVNGEK